MSSCSLRLVSPCSIFFKPGLFHCSFFPLAVSIPMGTRRYALAHCDRVIQYSKSMRTYTCLFNLAFVAGEMQAVYKDALHVPRPCLAVYCTEAA